ncbi:MAG TPA: sugar transferase [Verrucomicrobiae bacterium]|nr:sugar transferase [Verrucomicrobiae bacterium]
MSIAPDVYSRARSLESASDLLIEPLRRPYSQQRHWGAVVALCDAVIILGSGVAVYKLKGWLQLELPQQNQVRLAGLLVCYTVLALICKASQNLYASSILHSAQISRVRTLKSFVLASVLFILLLFLSGQGPVSPFFVALTMLLGLAGTLVMQNVLERQNSKRIDRGMGTEHVLIVGAGQIGQAFRSYLETHRYLGKTFCGFVDDTHRSGADWLGTAAELPVLLSKHFIDEVYFTPEIDRALIMEFSISAKEAGVAVKVVPDLYDGLALGAGVTYIGNVPVLQLSSCPEPPFLQLMSKRLIDIVCAVCGLILSFPILIAAAIAIKMESVGPVIYAAWRVGRKGKKFRCYKLRTMVDGADDLKEDLRHMNERNGATFKITNDPRITRVGRLLRKYSVDEMPQFLNVLRGEMSIVGPRPHPVDDFRQYRLTDLRRLEVPPGITGLWQVSARRDPSFEKNVLLDLEYIEKWSFMLDLEIALRTIPEVFRGSGR